jgi:hypothetical protein
VRKGAPVLMAAKGTGRAERSFREVAPAFGCVRRDRLRAENGRRRTVFGQVGRV